MPLFTCWFYVWPPVELSAHSMYYINENELEDNVKRLIYVAVKRVLSAFFKGALEQICKKKKP